MKGTIQIDKRAFLARLNERAGLRAVDSYYKRLPMGHVALMIVYSDGTERPFKGLAAAA